MAQSSDRERTPNEPATLYGVMQEAIGKCLRKHYEPEREVPHQLLVQLLQINHDRRRSRLRAVQPRRGERHVSADRGDSRR